MNDAIKTALERCDSATRIKREKWSQRISDGEATTREYRQWCEDTGILEHEGVLLGVPHDIIVFPFDCSSEPVWLCSDCKRLIPDYALDGAMVLGGRRNCANGDAEPDEYEDRCPICGSSNLAQEPRCIECGCIPCCCYDNVLDEVEPDYPVEK
jgi:hypothetical protein